MQDITIPAAPQRGIASVVKKLSIQDQTSDFAYWQTRPYEERLAALEEIRSGYHHWEYGYVEQGFQRVYTIVKRQ